MRSRTVLRVLLIWGAFAFILFSCKEEPFTPKPSPLLELPRLTPENYQDVRIDLTGYHSISFRHKLGSYLLSDQIKEIRVYGSSDDILFGESEADTVTLPGMNILSFDFIAREYDQWQYPFLNIKIQYIADSSDTTIRLSIPRHKYPYASAKLNYPKSHSIQSPKNIAANQYGVFVLAYSIYRWDSTAHTFHQLDLNAEYYMAANSRYLFYQTTHHTIARYDCATQSTDTSFAIPVNPLNGIAADEQSIYLFNETNLYRYSLDMALLDSFKIDLNIPWYDYVPSISVNKNILYLKGRHSNIFRYDLEQRTLLPQLWTPSQDLSALAVANDRFYFLVWGVNAFGVIPLQDMLTTDQTPPPVTVH